MGCGYPLNVGIGIAIGICCFACCKTGTGTCPTTFAAVCSVCCVASGLLWSNTSAPVVGYGFFDSTVKTGVVLYSNLLLWNATRLFSQMADAAGDAARAARMRATTQQIQVRCLDCCRSCSCVGANMKIVVTTFISAVPIWIGCWSRLLCPQTATASVQIIGCSAQMIVSCTYW